MIVGDGFSDRSQAVEELSQKKLTEQESDHSRLLRNGLATLDQIDDAAA